MNIVKYYLLTDVMRSHPNPGDILIGNGIEYLLDKYEKRRGNIPIFNYVGIFGAPDFIWDRAYEDAGYIVVCGTPQLSQSIPEHFGSIFYTKLRIARDRGIKLLNLYMGVTGYFDKPEEEGIDRVVVSHGNFAKANFSVYDLVVTRSRFAQAFMERIGIKSVQLLGSAFYAPLYYGIGNNEDKEYNLITVSRDTGDVEKQMELFGDFASMYMADREVLFVAHFIQDWLAFREIQHDILCVNNPKSLAELYGKAGKVVSLRVHGSVLSVTFGALTMHLAIDYRSDILEYAGQPTVSYEHFMKNRIPCFGKVGTTDIEWLRDSDAERLFVLLDEVND